MKKSWILLGPIILLFLTGCWDRVDIENRAYVLGIAIDKYPPIPKSDPGNEGSTENEEEKFEMHILHAGEPVYAMTVQIPIIKKATLTIPSGLGGGGSSGAGSKTWEITQAGNSFMEMNRAISERVSFIPYYEQLQVIVISDDVAKKGLNNITDFFTRDPEMRRRTKLFISEGNAKRILDVNPRVEDYSSVYLAKIPLNAKLNAGIIYRTDLGEALQSIHSGIDFMLPIVDSTKDELHVSKAAVFHGDKMVGFIDDLEIEAVKLIRNLYIGGVITVDYPDSPRGVIVMEVTKAKTKIKPVISGSSVHFVIDISIDGNYAENVNMSSSQKISSGYLKNIEKLFSAYVENQCKKTIQKVQNECTADIFKFNKILKEKEPTYWKWAKDKWVDIFPNVKVDVNAKVTLRQVGNTR